MIKLKMAEQLKKLGKTATEAADEVGVNRNTINALVNNQVEGIRFETLEKICNTYNLNLNDLIEFVPSAPPILGEARKLYKQEAEMVPFNIWPGIKALSKITISGKDITQNFGRMDGFFRESYMVAYWDLDSMNKFARIFYDLNHESVKIDRYFAEYEIYASRLENLYETYNKKSPTGNEEQFLHLVNVIERTYIDFWNKSFFMETFDAGFDQKEINHISKKYHFTQKEIQTLTTPIIRSVSQEKRLILLNFAFKIRFKKEPLEKIMAKNQEEVDMIKQKYDFYRSNYANIYHLTDSEIADELKNILKDHKALKQELKDLTKFAENKQSEIDKVLRKHHLKTNPFYFFQKVSFMREYRQVVNQKGFHVLDYVLAYLETKTGISKNYLKFLSFDEIESALKGLVRQEILKERLEKGILISINFTNLGDIKIFEGEEARSLQEELEQEYISRENGKALIQGYTASQGFAKGKARIILSENDFKKFNTGDVLVTGMTKPDYQFLMKKAAAVITNESGATSHAAMNCRELNKPCIIGTKIATQKIKDGDLVEVRANHGTVRIIGK